MNKLQQLKKSLLGALLTAGVLMSATAQTNAAAGDAASFTGIVSAATTLFEAGAVLAIAIVTFVVLKRIIARVAK